MKPVSALICAGLLVMAAPVAAPPAAAQVEVTPLTSLDLFSAAASDTGLPQTLWRGAGLAEDARNYALEVLAALRDPGPTSR